MSSYYYVACKDCKKRQHITDNRFRHTSGIYRENEDLDALGKFLWSHEEHQLIFVREDTHGVEDFTDEELSHGNG